MRFSTLPLIVSTALMASALVVPAFAAGNDPCKVLTAEKWDLRRPPLAA